MYGISRTADGAVETWWLWFVGNAL